MKSFNLILISLIIWNCSNKKEAPKTLTPDKIKIDTLISLEKKVRQKTETEKDNIKNQPCIEIIEFVTDIKNEKWVPDNERLKKVRIYSELDTEKMKLFNDLPFYPITFEKSSINKAYNIIKDKKRFDSYIDFDLFKGVKNI